MQLDGQDAVIAAGASALVSLVRKKWPAIDGGWVWLATLIAAALLYGAFEVLPLLHPTAARIAGGALAVIAIVTGGKGVLAQLAGAAQQRLPAAPAAPTADVRAAVTLDGALLAPPAASSDEQAPR